METTENSPNQQLQHSIWIPTIGYVNKYDVSKLLPCKSLLKRKNKPKLNPQETKSIFSESEDNLAELIIPKQEQPPIIKEPLQTLAEAQNTMVLCPKNPNKVGIGKLTNTRPCVRCSSFRGIILPNNGLQRIACANSGLARMLEFYTSCPTFSRSVKLSAFCAKCKAFRGIDVSTGLVKCANRQSKQRLVPIFPEITANFYFPFQFPCGKTKKLTTLGTCKLCFQFKGLYKIGAYVKVRCQHSQAVESQYVRACKKPSFHFPRPKQKSDRKEKKINLAWLFDGVFEKKRHHSIEMQVSCVDKLHFAVDLNTNCGNNTTLADCRTCDKYKGMSSTFQVNCKAFTLVAIFVNCPHSKSSVRLQTCVDCDQFMTISGEKVKCRFSPIQQYVNKEPQIFSTKRTTLRRFATQRFKPYTRKRKRKGYGRLSDKPKFYYGSEEGD